METSKSGRKSSERLLQQHEPARQLHFAGLHHVEIHAARQIPRRIRDRVPARRVETFDDRIHLLAQHVQQNDFHLPGLRHAIGNRRARIKRIGIVPRQLKLRGQRAARHFFFGAQLGRGAAGAVNFDFIYALARGVVLPHINAHVARRHHGESAVVRAAIAGVIGIHRRPIRRAGGVVGRDLNIVLARVIAAAPFDGHPIDALRRAQIHTPPRDGRAAQAAAAPKRARAPINGSPRHIAAVRARSGRGLIQRKIHWRALRGRARFVGISRVAGAVILSFRVNLMGLFEILMPGWF